MKILLSLLVLALSLSASAANNPDDTVLFGIGAKTTQATTKDTIRVYETGDVINHRTVVRFIATPIVMNGSAGNVLYGGVGTGSIVPYYTFPKGNILIRGAEIQTISPSLTCSSAGSSTYASVSALGTVTAANDASLTGTEANILASTSSSAAVAKVAAIKNITLIAPGAPLDGTTTAIPVYLNFVIATDAANAAGTCTFTGTISINWESLSFR
jgi:hypothetical protein